MTRIHHSFPQPNKHHVVPWYWMFIGVQPGVTQLGQQRELPVSSLVQLTCISDTWQSKVMGI